jgi:4-hydroxybenzoate polyprenyltransferase
MKDFLNLIRWKNLLVILLGLLIVRISIINPFYLKYGYGFLFPYVNSTYYILFIFGILLIAAAANIINDYFDYDIDLINRDEDKIYVGRIIKKESALKLFYILASLGVFIHFAIGYQCGCIQLGFISIVFVLMAYFYSLKYKRMFIIGNIVIAFLYAMIIFLPAIFELLCLMRHIDIFKVLLPNVKRIGYMFLFLTVFTFLLTIIRDIVKDMRNETGDRDCDARTSVIVLGEKKTKTLLYFLASILILLTGSFLCFYFKPLEVFQVIIIGVIVICPLIYFIIELKKAKIQQDYDFLFQLLGMIFISLLFTLSFVKYIIINGLPA